jgi:lactoylglutathione lyase
MVRVLNLQRAIQFFEVLGFREIQRKDSDGGRFTLVFLESGDPEDRCQIELTHNWDETNAYSDGRNFGHIALAVENIYEVCERLQTHGVSILRPPRDGRMAFVRSPDLISIELLQIGEPLAFREPWKSMPSTGTW